MVPDFYFQTLNGDISSYHYTLRDISITTIAYNQGETTLKCLTYRTLFLNHVKWMRIFQSVVTIVYSLNPHHSNNYPQITELPAKKSPDSRMSVN